MGAAVPDAGRRRWLPPQSSSPGGAPLPAARHRRQRRKNRHGLEVLGRLPLDTVTAVAADAGQPIVVAGAGTAPDAAYAALARRVAQVVAMLTYDEETRDKEKFQGFFNMERGQ